MKTLDKKLILKICLLTTALSLAAIPTAAILTSCSSSSDTPKPSPKPKPVPTPKVKHTTILVYDKSLVYSDTIHNVYHGGFTIPKTEQNAIDNCDILTINVPTIPTNQNSFMIYPDWLSNATHISSLVIQAGTLKGIMTIAKPTDPIVLPTGLLNFKVDGGSLTYLKLSLNSDKVKSSIKIDIKACPLLETFSLENENLTNELTSINLSNNTKLKDISINNANLKRLDLSKNINLNSLNLNSSYEMASNLKTLDLSQNILLTQLDIEYIGLTSLNLSQNKSLSNLWLAHTSLTNVDLSNDIALESIGIVNNHFKTLELSHNVNLATFYDRAEKETYLTSLDFSKNPKLNEIEIDDSSNLKSINLNGDVDLKKLTLEGIDCPLSVSHNLKLTTLDISNSNLTSLDLSNNTALIDLSAENIKFQLDLSRTNVQALDINGTPLTSYDLSNVTTLQKIYASDSKLTSINVSNNTKLKMIDGNNSNLETITFKGNTNLRELDLNGTKIKNLSFVNKAVADFIGTINLDGCSDLTSLNLTNYTYLENLSLKHTSMSTIDISNNYKLSTLDISNSNIASLDISNNQKLLSIYINNTLISSLNMTNTVDLNYINVSDCKSLTKIPGLANWQYEIYVDYNDHTNSQLNLEALAQQNHNIILTKINYSMVH